MNILIIGGAGFVAEYLFECLSSDNENFISVTKLSNETLNYQPDAVFNLDITDYDATYKTITEVKPDQIYVLAAQSSVSLSWKNPQLTFKVNVLGIINLLEVIRQTNNTRVLLIGSSEEYGITEKQPINEEQSTKPLNPYGISKMSQTHIGKMYKKAYGLDVIMTRSFNHIGPKQLPQFVISDFCNQISLIEKGNQEPVIRVGNINVKRDFTDVRDVVKAYRVLMEKGEPGEVYNVGSGTPISLRVILEDLISLSTSKIEIIEDKDKYRPNDIEVQYADISKIDSLGWKPLTSIKDSLKDILNYWRNKND